MPTYDLNNGLIVEMRLKEKGHSIPHAHAWIKGDKKHEVSIAFDGRTLVGGFKRGHKEEEKRAAQWIVAHADELRKYWRDENV